MEVRQSTNDCGFFVGWHKFEFFAVPPAKRSLFYAAVPVFCNKIESLQLLCGPSPLCLAYYSGVVLGNKDCNTQRVQRVMALELVNLRLGLFLRTVLHGITTGYYGGCIQLVFDGRGTLVPLSKRIWTLLGEYGIVHVLSCFDVDPIRGSRSGLQL